MIAAEVAYLATALVVLVVGLIIWLTVRYNRYMEIMRSGIGKKPKPVWKPFWIE